MEKYMNKKYNTYGVCYDTLYVFKTKEEAKKYFTECYELSEGAERERYASILIDLNKTNLADDNVSVKCKEIAIKYDVEQRFLNIYLNEPLSIESTVKFYENNVKPVIEVSDDYEIRFKQNIPFEYFGSDAENNTSFTEYYNSILKKQGYSNIDIQTIPRSDGKYILIINDEDFDIRAWDNFDNVLDTLESISEYLNNDLKFNSSFDLELCYDGLKKLLYIGTETSSGAKYKCNNYNDFQNAIKDYCDNYLTFDNEDDYEI